VWRLSWTYYRSSSGLYRLRKNSRILLSVRFEGVFPVCSGE
jgi:hypothetical protein